MHEQAPNYISMFYDELDQRLLGGTQWGWTDDFNDKTKDGWNAENFSIVDQRRNMRPNFAVRPYPKAIAGNPGQFKVSPVLFCVIALKVDVSTASARHPHSCDGTSWLHVQRGSC